MRRLCSDITAILFDLDRRFTGNKKWSSLLNSKGFLHECEEALVPLAAILGRSTRTEEKQESVVIDLCSGKGIFGVLLAYLIKRRGQELGTIKRIVLVEKNTKINFTHVSLVNADLAAGVAAARPVVLIDVWPGTNIFDAALLLRLRQALVGPAKSRQPFIVGIHLCRRLSSRAIELGNVLEAPLLVLAPCCMPRYRGKTTVPITVKQQGVSLDAMLAKKAAAADMREKWLALCWRCRAEGHSKAQCTVAADEAADMRAAAKRRAEADVVAVAEDVMSLDPKCLSSRREEGKDVVGAAEADPFKRWAAFLFRALVGGGGGGGGENKHVLHVDLGTTGDARQQHHDAGGAGGGGGIQDRRATWLVKGVRREEMETETMMS